MRKRLAEYSAEERKIGNEYTRVILPWIAQNPGMTEEQIEWLLQGIG